MALTNTEEDLRERLLDLENLRAEEKRRRHESESILAGMEVLTSHGGGSALFTHLLETLQPAFGFDAGAVLIQARDGTFHPVAATDFALERTSWTPGRFLTRVLAGTASAAFDTGMLPEWQRQPRILRDAYNSLLALPLHTGDPPTLLLCLHGDPHAFTRRHVELAERFWPVADTALNAVDLERRNTQLAAAVEATRVGVFLMDVDAHGYAHVQWANPAFTRLTGYRSDQFTIAPWRALAGPDADADDLGRLDAAAARELSSARAEIPLIPYDGGTAWCTIDVTPVHPGDPGDSTAVGLLTDVSDRRAMEEHLRRNEAQLRETVDRLNQAVVDANAASEAKSAFLANMSHELRTPLNAILGFAEVIKNERFGPVGVAAYTSYAADIHESGAHLLDLINDILDVSKIEVGRRELDEEPVEPGDLSQAVIRMTRERAANHGQTVKLEVADDMPAIRADATALRQIMINLISNALKFSPQGGRIAVCWRCEDGAPVLSVTDDGPGMSADEASEALKPFTQVGVGEQANEGGTGLGLTLVQQLAHLHGGELQIHSSPGEGTAVHVRLPGSRRLPPAADLAPSL